MMNGSVVQEVEKWYAEHSASMSKVCTEHSIGSKDPGDSAKGKVEIRMETPQVLASVTFWNDRNVSALVIDKPSKTERVLDDRPLISSYSVTAMLDGYYRQITK